MERKYQVLSANALFSMNVNAKIKDSDETFNVRISVDYAQNRVYWIPPIREDIDLDDLEQEILAFIRPPVVDTITLAPEILEKLNKVRSGDYQSEFNPERK